jgi:hypothetical protein
MDEREGLIARTVSGRENSLEWFKRDFYSKVKWMFNPF